MRRALFIVFMTSGGVGFTRVFTPRKNTSVYVRMAQASRRTTEFIRAADTDLHLGCRAPQRDASV